MELAKLQWTMKDILDKNEFQIYALYKIQLKIKDT
jgi:hypothetical protein